MRGESLLALRTRFGPVLAFIIAFVAIATLSRVALLVRALDGLSPTAGVLSRIFGAGLALDLVAAAYGAAPFALLLLLVPDRLYRMRPLRLIAHGAVITGLFVLIFAAIAEWFFWGEFSARFNFIAVDYLVYTREVLENIWQSYPVVPLLAAAWVVALLLWAVFLRPVLADSFERTSTLRGRSAAAAVFTAIPLACFFASGAQLPRFAENRFANELAANGLYNLFSAFRNNQLDYAPFYVTEDSGDASRALRELLAEPTATFASDDATNLTRDVSATRPERQLNVVLIVVESLSAKFLGAFGSPDGLTPNLDRLAGDGLLFTNLRATGTRTVRGLEAVSLSVPPTPGYSIVKRPNNSDLFSIGTVFRDHGYHARFFYGGNAFFDNMGAFFGGNGFDVIDFGELTPDESEFANAWGAADEFVFRRVLREANRSHEKGERFLSLMLTTSNHRPFTYPGGRIDIPSGQSRAGAVKYTDFAIGQFIDQARREPWFDDTVFVIVADHCASSAGELDIPVDQYHIPMVIYSPKHVPAQRVDTLASQMDLAPTLLELLGFSYRSRFFGRDILATPVEEARALLGTYQRLGYLKDGLLTILSPGRHVDVYRIEPDGRQVSVADEVGAKTLPEAIAFYQSASAVYSHPTADHLFASKAPR